MILFVCQVTHNFGVSTKFMTYLRAPPEVDPRIVVVCIESLQYKMKKKIVKLFDEEKGTVEQFSPSFFFSVVQKK